MFEYKGGQYTYEDLQLEAKKQGVEFNDFMEKMKGLGMTYGSNAPEKGLNLDMSSQQPFGQNEDEEERGVLDVLKSYGASLGIGTVSIADNLTKLYETGEGGFLGEVLFENPFVASYGYAAEYLRGKGYDIPEEFLGIDLTTPGMRREIYENHMLDAREKGLTLEQAQKLDPTNKIKFEETLEWFNKHTYTYKDENGDPMDYLGLFSEAESAGDYAKVVDAFVNDAFGAVPSLVVSRLPYGSGAAILGAGAYMDNFEREMYKRGFDDETTRNQVVLDSFINGASDFTMELIGGRILNKIIGSGIQKDKAKDLLTNIPKVIATKFFKGYASEFGTEGATGWMQTKSKNWSYGDVVTYKQQLRAFFKDGFLGGFLGGGATVLSTPNQRQVYDYVSPSVYKQEQLKLEKEIVGLTKDADNAEGNNKEILESKIKELQDKKELNKKNLYEFFDSLTKAEKQEYANNIDEQHKNLDIIGNSQHSEATQKKAKEDYKKFTDANSKFFAGIDVDYDSDLEQAIGRTLKASERIQEQKGVFGFNKKNLDIEYVDSEKRLEELNAKFEGFDKADGMFVDNSGSKSKIYINQQVAALTGATNVIGHEYLHAIVSQAFSEGIGAANLKGATKSFVEYLKSTGPDGARIVERIEERLANKYNGRNAKGDIIRDSNGLVKTKKKADQEEYFNLFSDIIKDEKIESVEAKSAGIKNSFRALFRGLGFGEVDFQNGQEVFDFLVDYNTNMKRSSILGKLTSKRIAKVKMKGLEAKADKRFKSGTDALVSDNKKSVTDSKGDVDNLGKMGWNDKTWKESGAKFAIETIKDEKLIDALIYAKYKVENVPVNFINDVITALTPDIKKFNSSYINKKTGKKVEAKWGTKDENNSLFGYLQGLIQYRADDVYNELYKGDDAIKGAKNIGETTKEGEVKIQVAAEKSAEMEAFEEEDLSIQGQAKKAKADKQRYSEYRQKLGFETGSKIYNEVLDNVKKSLMMAYGATQNIEDAQLRAKAIATKLKKEYANLNSPLFKQIKNFLTYGVADVYVKRGTKDIYISNLKKFREDIVKNTSTADLVQMERNTPEADRIFTNFVKVLTSIEQVQDAVNKEQLPPEALNKITKDKKTGKGAFSPSLYNKIMPTETELISWADQPGINPVTGLRQGLKGTRKDGIAMRMVNGLVTDAIMEARQSEEVQNKIANMDIDPGSVAELGAAIGREVNVKFSKSNAIGDISAAIDGAGDVNVYSQIKFSKSHREAYEKQLTKKRPDLTEDQRKNAVQSVFDFVDGKDIPNNKKSKYEKMAMHYTANGFLILPEDGYKVIEAERIATQKKIDPFSFKNPNVLIETFVGEVKGTRTNPDNVKTFSNKTELTDGVTVYDIEDSKRGQKDVRKVIDTHFGEKSNPWCLVSRQEELGMEETIDGRENAIAFRDGLIDDGYVIEDFSKVEDYGEGEYYRIEFTSKQKGELGQAWQHWKDYNKEGNGHKIAFHNGRLVAFRDGNEMRWWDRNDKPADAPVVRGKKDKDGFKPVSLVYKNKSEVIHQEKVTGNKKNGTTMRKDLDGNLVFQETKKNGRTDGLNIEVDNKNKRSNNYNLKRTQNFKDGQRLDFKEERTYSNPKVTEKVNFGKHEIRVNNITKYDRSFTERDWVMEAETITIEGTVNQKYFKEFQDPSELLGFEKANINHLSSAHERYYGIQGKKVKIVKTTKYGDSTDGTGKTTEDVTVTIDGVKQEIIAKFSKSAENNVKFSLTKLEVDRKLGPYLAKQLKDATSMEEQAFWSGIQGLVKKGLPVAEAHNVMAQKIKNQYGVEIVGIKQLDDNVKNYYLPKIREAAKEFSVDWYKGQLKEAKGDIKAELDIINDYIINIGRPIRSGMVYNITSNEKLMNDVYKQFGNKYKAYYKLVPTNNGQKVMFRTKEGGELQDINLYQDVTAIKSNPKQYWGKIDEQSVKAREWLNKLLDSKQSDGIKKAIIQLTSYGQRSPIRKLSKAGVYVEGLPTSKTTLEHEITVNDIHSAIINYIDGKQDKDSRKKLNKLLDKTHVHVLPVKIDAITKEYGKTSNRDGMGYESMPKAIDYLRELDQNKKLKGNTDLFKFSRSQGTQTLNNAIKLSRSTNNPTKGITVLDFDDTLATSKSMIRFTRPDGTKGKLNAEQYASTYQELSELGYKWDFSEFNKVVDGKTAPLFNKAMKLQGKFGPENMFVLTARPAESAAAIHAFLKANGLNIPLKNITGLANSTSEAKALWMAEKVGEGYNDFYFADDALQNVQAVKNMLDQFDVKSKVQQARVKFSKNMNTEFNKVLERTTGVDANEIISGARAAKRGASKGKYKFFVPPSADDFKGLLYYFVGKGKQGEKDMAFLKKALTDPLNRAYTEFNAARQSIANDYRNLKKQMPDVKKKLLQKTPDSDFTYGDAVRVYLWNKAGFDVPGLNQKDVDNLVEMVTSDPQLMIFAYKLGKISKRPEGYTNPTEHWQVGDIRNDLADATGRVGRKEFFTEFIENAEQIFGKMVNGKLTGDNINKIEAIYGSNFREALEDILYATYTGSSRPYGSNRMVNGFTNWINGSVGATMFVNMRSALLQQMSSVNFLNWGDNNIFKAGLAFANFPQYIKDWAMIFNSDKLKQRRSGLSMDINANELATYLGKSKSKPAALLSWLLQKGFLPTQVSDSIAIANGGAGFYRNRVNTYLKQGFKQKEAEEKAWNDFSEIAEETQQSARPDMVSQQQRSPIGKWFLNFLNTPMQYSRIMKKAMLDLVNRRGDAKTHISRIIYYGAAQNAIFYTLQTGLFAAMFDDDDEEAQKFFDTKAQMTANSMVDGLLKGLGFGGAAISTVKNMIIKFIEEDRKGYKGKPAKKVTLEMVNFSPVVGIKVRKISNAIDRYSWDKELVKEMETFDIDNPIWGISTGIVEGATNVPLNRLYRKVQNVRAATDADREAWQRLALVSGWSVWNIGEQNKELEKLKDEIKARKKKSQKSKSKKKKNRFGPRIL